MVGGLEVGCTSAPTCPGATAGRSVALALLLIVAVVEAGSMAPKASRPGVRPGASGPPGGRGDQLIV
ncbi:MAG: hypothetical protein R3F54_01745 [Alphaproteobacteria bacterium]